MATNQIYLVISVQKIVLERTVRCSRTVRFFVLFDMFEVQFWAKIKCDVQKCSKFGPVVYDQTSLGTYSFLRCSTCSKFDFGPKCDVRKVQYSDIQFSKCSKFGILVFVPRLFSSQSIHGMKNAMLYCYMNEIFRTFQSNPLRLELDPNYSLCELLLSCLCIVYLFLTPLAKVQPCDSYTISDPIKGSFFCAIETKDVY